MNITVELDELDYADWFELLQSHPIEGLSLTKVSPPPGVFPGAERKLFELSGKITRQALIALLGLLGTYMYTKDNEVDLKVTKIIDTGTPVFECTFNKEAPPSIKDATANSLLEAVLQVGEVEVDLVVRPHRSH
jgi:hypothetical protein